MDFKNSEVDVSSSSYWNGAAYRTIADKMYNIISLRKTPFVSV